MHASFHWLPLVVLTLAGPVSGQNPLKDEAYLMPPPEIARLVDAPRQNNSLLTDLSPDGSRFLVSHSGGMPSIADLARPYVNLGGNKIDARARRDRSLSVRGVDGYESVEWRTGKRTAIRMPEGARASGAVWSPDGKRVAYIASFDDRSLAYVADVATGASKRVGSAPLNAVLVTRLRWVGSDTLVVVQIPPNQGPMPVVPAVPVQPLVKTTEPTKNVTRTYRTLMTTGADQALLEYLVTGQLAVVNVGNGKSKPIGKPGMIQSVDPSPDAAHFRVTTMQKPFSYIVPVSSFGSVEELWDAAGTVVAELDKRPLRTGDPDAPPPAANADARRALAWRPDGKGLGYLQQVPAPAKTEGAGGEDEQRGTGGRSGQRGAANTGGPDRKDRVMQWLPPYGKDDAKLVYENDVRIGSVRYSADGQTLFMTDTRSGTETLFAVKLADPGTKIVLTTKKPDEFTKQPGDLVSKDGPYGLPVVRQDPNGAVLLSGTQYFDDSALNAPRPFLDSKPLAAGDPTRVWQSGEEVYETIAAVLDDSGKQLVLTRQSPSMVPDSYMRDAGGTLAKMTSNTDLAPEITQAPKTRFKVKRADGFTFWVTARVPKSHVAGNRLPTFFWFYPREFTDQKAYDLGGRTYNKNLFPTMGAATKDYLVALGYAVVEPDCPIVGATGRMNDLFAMNLRNNLSATIDELERRGISDRDKLAIGGHSYGAFGTAHAMIQTPYFKAGIAGDGNYNRTLTPLSFQSEQRMLWEAREMYESMSAMLYADQLTGALLMYHGMDDHNVGTNPINSERMFQVLDALGKPAALYMYPYEDHGPVARETLLDMWARWVAWLDKYLK